MADSIRKGYSRTNFVQTYNEIYDIYLKLIGKGVGVAYYSYLKRYVNNESESDYNGYAFPGTRKIANDLGIGTHTIKEVQLKCVAFGLLNVIKQEYSNNLYEVNDPLPKEEFFKRIEEGSLPIDLKKHYPELLPKNEKETEKIIDDIIKSASLLVSDGVLLTSNRVKEGVADEQQGCCPPTTVVLPTDNGGVADEQSKKKNLNTQNINNINNNFLSLWSAVAEKIKGEVTTVTFNTWIKTLKPINMTNDSITLATDNEFNVGIIESRYKRLILNTIEIETGKKYNIMFVVE